ncbi:YbbR-like domain-containing protein [Mucilaginibacter mali]|uniref:YbbR-like domain-containing protein n=1 Tax=Mucilaginibacter mali TaxID=2740462 RepID=A0A7D4QTB5_9SPHI|nr:YbbR-like domain-containing protein [Mucilaginibacter mali]QKJ30569.1 YbbR-like domain-containing protein [Mucilaginibacter mali]
MAIIKLSAIERRRLSVFITCLVLAAVAWVFVALSEDHEYVVKQVLTFKNSPQKRAFHSLQSDTVDVTIHGNGWQMLFSKLQAGKISIDLHTLEQRNYVVLGTQIGQINAGRDSSNMVIAISPDTLYFDFTNRMMKRVPVKLMLAINYQRQFGLSDDIGIKPAYVTISGPANRINNISQWPTDSLKLRNINEAYSNRLTLRPVNDGSMTIVPKTVEVNIPVDEFTEKTLYVPVKLLNPDYDNVKIFPQKVKLTFTVSLGKYAETDEGLFEATANLDLWRKKGYTTLPVNLTQVPPHCKIVSIEPRNIDFIVKK